MRYAGYRGAGYLVGGLFADEAVYGERVGDRGDPFATTQLQSHLDGLAEWSGFRAVNWEAVPDDDGFTTRIEASVETADELSWKQGDAAMQILPNWRGGAEPGLHFDEWVVLRSTFDTPRPLEDHLDEQMKVRLLLTVLTGTEISFRRHEVRDERFYPRFSNGHVYSRHGEELIAASTFREYGNDPASHAVLADALVSLSEVGKDGLESWADKFAEWQRVIYPAASALGRKRPILEEKIATLAMSLESAGSILGFYDGEEATYDRSRRAGPTTATWFFRCIEASGIDWSRASSSNVGLARALKNVYVDVKHHRPGAFPGRDELFVASNVLEVTVRRVLMQIAAPAGDRPDRYDSTVVSAVHWISSTGLRVDDDGHFVRSEASE